jgi:Secretion system C-terminal sorting domain
MLTKKLLTLLALATLISTAQLTAQKNLVRKASPPTPSAAQKRAVLAPRAITGLEEPSAELTSVPPAQSILRSVPTEEVAGITYYDLQTNGTEQARIHQWVDGTVSMAWTGANVPTTWTDRGSFYNRRSNWQAGTVTTARTETVRTGFTNHVVAGGVEMLFAHRSPAAGQFRINVSRRQAGAATWTESDLPTNTPNGGLWCKAAADGDYVHVLMLTTPVGSTGVRYRGMDGHVLYYRSPDRGVTWDIVDGVIPGLDSTAYAAIGPDSYAIAAKNGTVAVATFDSWNHAQLFKSANNGTTWGTPVTFVDFPLFKYEANQGYTFDQVGMDYDSTSYPDSLAIFTNDGAGSILFDALGNVHLFMGEMFVIDENLADAGTNYYPGTNGLMYWNEVEQELTEITFSLDINDNDTLDITNAMLGNPYGVGLSSMPATAADELGGIYLAYSAMAEDLVSIEGLGYRHIYLMKSEDFGATWSTPVDHHYRLVTDGDFTLARLTEGVYPAAEKSPILSGGSMKFQYQRDFTPGSDVLEAPAGTPTAAEMVYVDDADLVGLKVPNLILEFGMSPNPTNGNTTLVVDLNGQSETNVQIIDVTGSVVRNLSLGQLVAGRNAINLPTADLITGMYFVRVQSGNKLGAAKLMVQQ